MPPTGDPPKWDPKDPAGSAKAYADWLAGGSGGGNASGSGSASTNATKPPDGFTVPVPGSNNTSWYNPDSQYIWSAPQGANGTPYTTHANKTEIERITGSAPAAAGPTQSLPTPPQGFTYITGTDKAYAAPAPGSKATALGSTAFYNTTTGKWSVYNATASDLALVKSQGLGTTPPAANAAKPAAAGAAATTQPAAGQPAGAPPAAPPALNAPPVGVQSPYAQTQAATKSLVTPQSTGLPQQSVTVPNTYQGGPSGFQGVTTPQGQQNMAVPHEFSFGPANFNPAVTAGAPVPPAAQTPPARVDPLAGTSAGLASTGVAPPPTAPQGLFRPPNVGDAGLAAGIGATGPAPTGPTGGVDLSQYGGAWLPDGSAWFPIQGGKTLDPASVALVERTWADSPGNIPTMLGIATRESGGKADAVGINGPNTGAPGTRDAGLLQINENNWPSLGLTAQSVLNPETNVAAARTLFDRSQGAGPWGGADIYNPKGYSWAQNLQSGTPPPNALGPIQPNPVTGQAAQAFTPPGAPPPPAAPAPGGGGGGGSWGGSPVPAPPQNQTPTGLSAIAPSILNGVNALTQFGQNPPRGLSAIAPSIVGGVNNALNTFGGTNPNAIGGPDTGPAASPAVPQTNLFYSGPQTFAMSNNGLADRIGGLNGATGYNSQVELAGNGIKSTGDADLDATIAAQLIQKQNAMGANAGFADPLANRSVGAATTFQSPLSGPLMNEQRTDHGYVFSPGNINSTESLRSPMNSGMYTPVMTPQGVVLTGANGAASPAAQAMAYQQAGYGPRPLGADRQPDVTQAPYMMSPTSNVGAVIQAAQAQAAQPQLPSQQFTGGAYLAGPNPNSNLGPTPVDYANAANLPSPAQLQTLGQANQDPLAGNTDFQNAGGAAGGDRTQYFAGGGGFSLAPPPESAGGGISGHLGGISAVYGNPSPQRFNLGSNGQGGVDPASLERALQQISAGSHSQSPSPYANAYAQPGNPVRAFARGGNFITTQPTMFPMRGGGTAETSEYGQPELINQRGSRVKVTPMTHASNMSPLRGYATGGTFTTNDAYQPELARQASAGPMMGYATGGTFNTTSTGNTTTVPDGPQFTPEGNPIPTDTPYTPPAPATPPPTSDPMTPQGNPVPTYTPPTPPSADLPPTSGPYTPQGNPNPDYQPPLPTTPAPAPAPAPTVPDLNPIWNNPGPAASPTNPYLDTGPEVGTQTGIASQANARANRNYLYSAAGVGAPVGIQSRTPLTNLAPNQFWQPLDYSSEIQNRQTQLAALNGAIMGPNGQPLDPSSLLTRQNTLRAMLGQVWGPGSTTVFGGTQPPPSSPSIGGPEAGTNDPANGQWITQSQIQAEIAANDLTVQQIQQARQLESEIANLRANQPAVTAPTQPAMSANTSAAQMNAAPTPATSPNLGIFLNALGDQSNSGKARRVDPMAAKAA